MFELKETKETKNTPNPSNEPVNIYPVGFVWESSDIFESRFQTYTTVLTLAKSLDSLEKWDQKNIFIWAHSNGGQIVLTFLAAS